MKIWKHEKKVARLFISHAEKVEECLRSAEAALHAYLDGDSTEEAAQRVNSLESEADDLRRQVRDVLYKGAFLPLLREDLYEMIAMVDAVANASETAVQFVDRQHPLVPDSLRQEFHDLTEQSMTSFKPLIQALEIYFKPKGDIKSVREHIAEVRGREVETDKVETRLTRSIFESSMELALKLHLRDAVMAIIEVSDRAENASDRLEQVSLKSLV